MSPFDLTGGPFLALYAVLFVITIIAGIAIPRWLRPEGHGLGRTTDTQQLAWLAGGRMRFADTIIAKLLATKSLEITAGNKFLAARRDGGNSAAEASVLALPQPIKLTDIARALKVYAEPLERALVSSGLAIDAGTAWQLRFWQTLPYALLFGFGAIKYMVGVARDKPVGFLTVFLIVTAIAALIRFAAVDRRTRRGVEALDAAILQSSRLRHAPTNDETAMAVALFGTTVLVGSAYAPFHDMRNTSSSGSSDSSSSDSGGGGCGGGGCGGCGG